MAKYTSIWKRLGNDSVLPGGFISQLVFGNTIKRSTVPYVELRKLAPDARVGTFVGEGHDAPILSRPGASNATVKAPTVFDKDRVNTSDIHLPFGVESVNDEQAMKIKTFMAQEKSVKTLSASAARAFEKMAVEAVFTGKVVVDGEGVSYVVDYGTNQALNYDPGAADPTRYWDGDVKYAEDDLNTAIEDMVNNGAVPKAIVAQSEGISKIKESLKGDLDNRRINDGLFEAKLLREYGAYYIGTWKGIEIYQYSGIADVRQADGTTQRERLVPADKVAIIGESGANGKFVGANEEILSGIISQYGGRYRKSADGVEFAHVLDGVSPMIYRAFTALPIIADTSSVATIKFKA